MDRSQEPPWEARQLKQVPFRPSVGGPPIRSASRKTSPVPESAQSGQDRGEEWQRRPSHEAFSPRDEAAASRPSPEVSSFAHRAGGLISPGAASSHAESVVSPGRSEVKALPGTMSARAFHEGRSSKSRRMERVNAADEGQNDMHSAGLGTKIKSAMKELFRRRGVDESKLEKIGDQHWSEDAY